MNPQSPPNPPRQSSPSAGHSDTHAPIMAGAAIELPASITVNGIAHAVMMVTPTAMEAFATGFAFSEGIIDSIDDLRDLTVSHLRRPLLPEAPQSANPSPEIDTITLELEISPRQWQRYRNTRQLRQGSSGCGLCGHEALATAMPALAPLAPSALPAPEQLQGLQALLAREQLQQPSGNGLHAALLRAPDGESLCCLQDIGRHNALDKVIGHALLQGVALENHSVLMSSRSSVELVQKAVRARLSTLLHLGSPSTLAIQLARHYRLNLLQVTRQQRVQVHAGPDSETTP
ncbi:formate dehydrogenase accessory sulfurtransferase FdhD [Pseudomaricurvus sp. HS19]|uniref:formate dehydrogenase accessory sulfurtransferase FdhD n=1 Tax=Pseudomaricurvus sp. HS19 TaxID=2692626 RepID=UPI00136B48A4|nr:formate dehydrogenase accessory sulfurtransferase FdhD [Pseudomaricurvus sp. HS19]MYM64959.1 sulfurtransferase FdhD [Pseudomaricurvus sp. HS19]